MASSTYKGLTVVTSPVGDGGQALTDNFRELADRTGKCNYTAAADPTVNDDVSESYYPGSKWVNTTTDAIFFCTDNTVGNAVWVSTTGGATAPVVTKITDYVVTTDDFGTTFVLIGVGNATFSLPSVAAANIGGWLRFIKTGIGTLTVDAADADLIADSGAGDTIYNSVALETYATLTIMLVTATQWVIIGAHGTWVTTT